MRRYVLGIGIGIVGAVVLIGLASIAGWAVGASSVAVLVSLGAFWIVVDGVRWIRRRSRRYGH